MVSLKTFAFGALASQAAARITAVTGPNTVAIGADITAAVQTEIYIQNYVDYGIVWGLLPVAWATSGCGACVGTQIAYTDLQTGTSPLADSGSTQLTITPNWKNVAVSAGDYILVAAAPYLVGASGSTGFSYFRTNVTVTSSS